MIPETPDLPIASDRPEGIPAILMLNVERGAFSS